MKAFIEKNWKWIIVVGALKFIVIIGAVGNLYFSLQQNHNEVEAQLSDLKVAKTKNSLESINLISNWNTSQFNYLKKQNDTLFKENGVLKTKISKLEDTIRFQGRIIRIQGDDIEQLKKEMKIVLKISKS